MTEIEIVVTSPAQKALVAKTCRPLLPAVSLSEVLRRIGAGEALFRAALYKLDHDAISQTLLGICNCLVANGVPFEIREHLRQVSLADEPPRDIARQINLDVLRNMISSFDRIRQEEQDIAEREV